jgi:hypothetical protein
MIFAGKRVAFSRHDHGTMREGPMSLRRDVLLTAALAGTIATAALAQAPAIPNLSGVWVHPALGFGPELSGPGPVRNKSRLPSGASNFNSLVGDYTNPILKPETAAVVKRLGEISLSGRAFPDPDNQCLQNPVPYIFWNFTMRMSQLPNRVVLTYDHDDDYRDVRLNQPHPAKITPTLHGNSVGHYEGDTLVIDTIGVKLGPYRSIDRFGTPYSPALHVVERYRLLDNAATKEAVARAEKEWPRVGGGNGNIDPNGNGLQLVFTVEDEGVFTMPWSATITYGKAANPGYEERVCAENVQHEYDGLFYSDKDAHIPTADKPDF